MTFLHWPRTKHYFNSCLPSFLNHSFFVYLQQARTHNQICFACGLKNENWTDSFPLVEGDTTRGAACKPPVYTYWLVGSPSLWGSDLTEVTPWYASMPLCSLITLLSCPGRSAAWHKVVWSGLSFQFGGTRGGASFAECVRRVGVALKCCSVRMWNPAV